ncbi:ribbon-helix-helix domain-containing protein [Paracoccus endophyticus]|uniref:ribbon-helix-helix domain-containing protein n=1 Tax=Paracoccus endophyticus TaxID=2233774 RepID=UPI000DD7DFFF|nr:ribbon-helix-helix domain-containing protein [Paracoccus endophyticus]
MTEPLDLPPLTPPVKRSITIDGHATSVSLEDAFWRGLGALARARGTTPARLIADIDHGRPADVGLATAIRLVVLAQAQLARGPDGD